MKKKLLLIGLTLLTCIASLQAQTMTDSQVISYVKERNSAGVDSKSIVKELLAKGATKDQLEKIAAQQKNRQNVQASEANENFSRSRINNEEPVQFDPNVNSQQREIFGHDIFRSKELSFEPNMSMAISPTYVLGAGDELIIDVYGASQTSQKLTIAPDGSVTIPKIGPVGVSGLTVEQAQTRIRSAMGEHYINSSIKVSVGQTRTISISVMGEVQTPGTYTLSAFATVFHALYMAGGINEIGTLRDVKVARNGRIISTIDVYEYILSGRLSGNVELHDNDVIIVGAYDNLVNIDGKVKRPMWYEMKKNESIQDLLRYCGGFTGDAFTKTITINRKAGDKYSVYTIDSIDFSTFRLADEDNINIRGNEERFKNMVTVSGGVKRPGRYGMKEASTVKGLINLAGGLDEQAITDLAVLIRLNPDRTRKTQSIELDELLKGGIPDMTLQNEDSLVIASQSRNIDDLSIDVSGEVWSGGRFPYSENSSIQDYILLAGGLKVSASLLNIEISRRNTINMGSSSSEQENQIFTFNLNEDFTLQDGQSFKLQPYDKIFIHRSPAYEEQKSISIEGQVMYAGTYGLKDNNTRLSDIVKKAGGLKQYASAHNARLVRKYTSSERERQKQVILMARRSSDSLNIDTTNIATTYTVGIDLALALAKPGSIYDVTLQDGDQLTIPVITNTVRISGEVLYPNNVTYIPNEKGDYYISEAGGFTKRSYKSHAYIVYANGNVSRLSNGKIEPGCEIIVPTKEKRNPSTSVAQWVSIGSTIATLGAVLVNAFK